MRGEQHQPCHISSQKTVPRFLYFSESFQKLKKENLLKRKSFTHQCANYDNSSLIIVINFDTSASKIQTRTFMCKKETRTTKMKRRKNMLKLVFKILEAISSSLSKAWRLWENHSTNKNPQKTLKHLSTRQKPKTWTWTKSHSQLRKKKHHQLYHKICEENQKKSAEAKQVSGYPPRRTC